MATLSGCGLANDLRAPSEPFDPGRAPPAPDYADAKAWLAFPGRDGLERSTPPGETAIDEAEAPADVFFVHPTTFKGSVVWNAPWDASGAQVPLNPPVLLQQAGVFNGCCRIYAPHYRQVSLGALDKSPQAQALAYSDVAAAFRYYLAHENHGRPFIIASHSQGTGHAVRLLQEEVLGKPVHRQLVAAYLIGAYVPASFGELGLPVCTDAHQTGCVLSYNASQRGRNGARMLIDGKTYWWRGRPKSEGQAPALCVNPLSWHLDDASPPSANPGSLRFPKSPFPASATPLPALLPQLTGAVCRRGLLEVDLPSSASDGFRDKLSLLFGSYHLNDYGLFYAALRQNARERVAKWTQAHP